MLVRTKIFPQFVEKIEKLKLNLSKQRNKMLKIRSETLKTRKKGETIKPSGKIPGNFSQEFSESPTSKRMQWIPGISGKFFENFPFPGKLKIREKGKP